MVFAVASTLRLDDLLVAGGTINPQLDDPGESLSEEDGRRAPDGDVPRVLVVDDDALTRTVLVRSLRSSYVVLQAASGGEALERLTETSCDAVVLDVVMPRMNGFEVCQHIKARSSEAFLPVLMLTALDEPVARRTGFEAGADDFLIKPVSPHELRMRVRTFVRLRRQERAVRAQLEEIRRIQGAKDELVSLLVHDVRNPLQGVTAYLDLLSRRLGGEVPGRCVQLAEECRRATTRARLLLDDLLEVQLVEAGTLRLAREQVDVPELVRVSLTSVASIGEQRELSFDVAVEDGLVGSLDPRLARRALENVIINAIHHAPAGDRILIRAMRDGHDLIIEVADRGPGVPDTLKQQIFEKFACVESRRRDRTSHGVGLFLVKLATELHGGRATVRDRRGGGTIFSLFFGGALD